MYGIGVIPLIELLQKPNVTQKVSADDGSAAGDIMSFRAILDNLDVHGKTFGSKVEPSIRQLCSVLDACEWRRILTHFN